MALSPFPDEMNPGASQAPGLGILVNDTQIGRTNVYHTCPPGVQPA